MAAESVQPVPWVLRVATRGASRRAGSTPANRMSIELGALGVASLDQHRLGAGVLQLPGLHGHLIFVAGRRAGEQRRGLGKIRGDQRGERDQHAAERIHGVWIEQRVAARRDHHGIEHDRHAGVVLQSFGHGFDDRAGRKHADLDGIDLQVGGDRAHLGKHEVRRHHMHRLDPHRVLCRERRDHARAIDLQRGEGLEVRLDPGAA